MVKIDLEKYEKFLEESPLRSEMEEIARDIRDRRDNAMAMEFTRTISELLKENGIVVHCTEHNYPKNFSDESIENVYGVMFDSVDCTEHDRIFTDRIAELEKHVSELESELSVKENLLKIKSGLREEKPRIHIIGLREFGGEQYMKFDDVQELMNELESRE